MDAGRFERLHKSGGQPKRDAILDPGAAPAPGGEGQRARIGQRLTVESAQQQVRRARVIEERAAIDQAVAGAMLQRDAPLPARFARRRPRIGCGRANGGRRHRQRAVARQQRRPIVIAGVQRLFDQEAAKSGAIDEKIASDLRPIVECHRCDVTAFAILRDRDDAAFVPHHAARLGIVPQIGGIESGIELERPGDTTREIGPTHVARKAIMLRRQRARREIPQSARAAEAAMPQPMLVERHQPEPAPDRPESMDVAALDTAGRTRPADEFDAELESPLRRAEEIILVDPEPLIEQANLRDRRLAHADRADRIGFDQSDAGPLRQEACERGSRHPPCGSAADDDDAPDRGSRGRRIAGL